MTLSRRRLLQSTAAAGAIASIPFAPAAAKDAAAKAKAVLDDATDLILNAYPESASSAGLDTGEYAYLKSKLTDRSPEGQAAMPARQPVLRSADHRRPGRNAGTRGRHATMDDGARGGDAGAPSWY